MPDVVCDVTNSLCAPSESCVVSRSNEKLAAVEVAIGVALAFELTVVCVTV